jgi:hypothetical protein
MATITNAFVPFERHRNEDGSLYKDADGCTYLCEHHHPLIKGKEFCHAGELTQLVNDHNREIAIKSMSPEGVEELNARPEYARKPFAGEVILVNVLTFK